VEENKIFLCLYHPFSREEVFFLKQNRNKIKIKRKYMTGEHGPDPVNLKETTLEVKRQNSSHKNVGLIVCQHINDSSSNNSLNNKSQMPFRVEPI